MTQFSPAPALCNISFRAVRLITRKAQIVRKPALPAHLQICTFHIESFNIRPNPLGPESEVRVAILKNVPKENVIYQVVAFFVRCAGQPVFYRKNNRVSPVRTE